MLIRFNNSSLYLILMIQSILQKDVGIVVVFMLSVDLSTLNLTKEKEYSRTQQIQTVIL